MVGIRAPIPKSAARAGNRQISNEDFAKSEALGSSADAALDKSQVASSAVNVAYKDNYTDLCNYANSFLHSQEHAQDCVHQAFVGTLTTVQDGEQIRDLRGFLVSCVRNNCLSHLRKSKRESSYSLNEDFVVDDSGVQGESSSAATSVEIKTRWKKVKGAIDDLPSSQRSALLMAEFQGYSYSEIADQMHRSNNSVRQLISRARNKVRATADAGADWATIPAPAIEIERMMGQSHLDFNPSVLDMFQAKVSQLQAWMVNAFQGGVDSVAYTGATVATGAAVVALAATSPAPPAGSMSGEPAAGSEQNTPVLAQRPTGAGSMQSEKGQTSSAADSSQSEDSADDPGPGPSLETPPGKGESRGDKPGASSPGKGECVNNCGGEQSDGRGRQEEAADDQIDRSSSNAKTTTTANTGNGSCSATSVAASCLTSGNLISVSPRPGTVSAGSGTSTTTDQVTSDGPPTSKKISGTTGSGSSTNDTEDTSLGSADNSRSISPFTSVKLNSIESPPLK